MCIHFYVWKCKPVREEAADDAEIQDPSSCRGKKHVWYLFVWVSQHPAEH